ncbi:hypothetical protein [Pseudomonas simiae]|jgi:hypothetical protein|uniref:hypothetical protein n=1 Tax=Pseudomonas simiae TaxID=321846 RepID=UPI000AF0CE4C|nr:hypothetical protein [Pseudomonas simiae]
MTIQVGTELAARASTFDLVKFSVNELEVIQRKLTTALATDEAFVRYFFVVQVGIQQERRHT